MRKFVETKIVIASNNIGKIKEFKKLLGNRNLEVISLEDFAIPSPEETGKTFQENADLKAKYYSNYTKFPVLADDSGLVIDKLDGAPGIYSARWAGVEQNYLNAFAKIEKSLAEKGEVSSDAAFVCSLSLRWNDGHVENFAAKTLGKISFPPRGESGFGYDPIFTPNGYQNTFAQLPITVKNQLSHRALALKQLIDCCF